MYFSLPNALKTVKICNGLRKINSRGYDNSYSELIDENGLSLWLGYCCQYCSTGSYIYFNDIKAVIASDFEMSVLPINLWAVKEKFADESEDGHNLGQSEPKLRLASQTEVSGLGFPMDENSYVIVLYGDSGFDDMDPAYVIANSISFKINDEPKVPVGA